VWFLSPAVATILFFAAQIALSIGGGQPTAGVAGLAPRTPQAPRGERVVRPIEPADPIDRSVPDDDRALLRLLERHRTIRFRATP